MSKNLNATAPSAQAAQYLLAYLADAVSVTGYRPAGAKVQELLSEDGIEGHLVILPAPGKGFRPEQVEVIRSYAQSLSLWRELTLQVKDLGKTYEIEFRIPDLEAQDYAPKKPGLRQRIKDWLTPRSQKVAHQAGETLVQNGFMVREPVPAVLLTKDRECVGHALYVRYPESTVKDLINAKEVYDRMVPYIADIYARAYKLKSEAHMQDRFVTIFFTKDKRYVSSLYENFPQFRIVLPRRRGRVPISLEFLFSRTYRACNKIKNRYKKDFSMPRKPRRTWDHDGHCIFMHYKKGAHGRVVDESYLLTIRRMAEKVMHDYKLQSSIDVHPATGTIIVSFFLRTFTSWKDRHKYVAIRTSIADREAEPQEADEVTL